MNSNLIIRIQELREEFDRAVSGVSDVQQVETSRIQFLGRKGAVSDLFKQLGELDPGSRKQAGHDLNGLKNHIQSTLDRIKSQFGSDAPKTREDVTLPGYPYTLGRLHPLTIVLREIKSSFRKMGFISVQGPEVETQYYNFEALNIPKGHPAREMWDTLFLDENTVLRTHTSPVQVRVMEKQRPPVRIISPGRCYRRDTPDATHSPFFNQVEGLAVDEGITFGEMKGVLLTFAKDLFGSGVKIRFRPSFFPFTEPSVEYDFSCVSCNGKGCRMCKGTGWIEISGAGMVNPEVFRFVDYDPEKVTGYAFGMGLERIALLLYGVQDIRHFFENDIRFLKQF